MAPRKFKSDANYFGGKRKKPLASLGKVKAIAGRAGTKRKKLPMPTPVKATAPTHGAGVSGRF